MLKKGLTMSLCCLCGGGREGQSPPPRPACRLRSPPCCGAGRSRLGRWRTAASTAPHWPPTPAAQWSAGRCFPAGSAAPSPISSRWQRWRGEPEIRTVSISPVTPPSAEEWEAGRPLAHSRGKLKLFSTNQSARSCWVCWHRLPGGTGVSPM